MLRSLSPSPRDNKCRRWTRSATKERDSKKFRTYVDLQRGSKPVHLRREIQDVEAPSRINWTAQQPAWVTFRKVPELPATHQRASIWNWHVCGVILRRRPGCTLLLTLQIQNCSQTATGTWDIRLRTDPLTSEAVPMTRSNWSARGPRPSNGSAPRMSADVQD